MHPNTKNNIFFLVIGIFLFLSLYLNVWKIAPVESYKSFDLFSESLVLGKISSSADSGIFYYSGFPGINYNKADFPENYSDSCDIVDFYRVKIANKFKYAQIISYSQNTPYESDAYCPYLSQLGGQSYFYAVVHKVLPFDNSVNYQIFRFINVLLITLTLLVFIRWINRNFGFIASFVTFIFVFLSQWIVLYSGNGLWWSLWSFYLPFLVVLILLEKRNSGVKISDKKIFLLLSLAVFIKCFFSGFEFITVSLLSVFCPVVYYYVLEKKTFSSFFFFSFKLGLFALLGLFTYMMLLVIQLYDYFGGIDEAVNYIMYSYEKRAAITSHPYLKDSFSVIIYLIRYYYIKGNAFEWGFLSLPFKVYYSYLFIVIFISTIAIYLFSRKLRNRKYFAMIIASYFSILCSLSWIIIFRDHSLWHPHLNFIIWYIPFLLYGFALIGIAISLLIKTVGNGKNDI